MPKNNKCTPLKDEWCKSVRKFAHFGDPDAKGLNVVDVISFGTNAKGKGMLVRHINRAFAWLNFCPFCGADVSKRTSKEYPNGD